MAIQFLSSLVPSAYALCDLSEKNLDLAECFTLGTGKTVQEVYTDPATLVNLIVRNVFVLAGIILFAMILFAGFKFISGASGKAVEESKNILQTVIIGFLVMFSAYWIIQIIEVLVGTQIL